MALIEWKERMSVGVEALDNDHRKLIGLLNQLHDVMRSERSDETPSQIVRELVKYTEYHFDCEERLMRLSRYPDYEAHVRIHRDLKRRLVSFEQKLLSVPESEALILPLFDFLSDWLMRHILREDMKYRPYLTRATPTASAPTTDTPAKDTPAKDTKDTTAPPPTAPSTSP
ncbi:bacteriohemerythrin [Roseospira visakhapatnamensis]|uniref:Hemerythrin n=1 Tax=Roseospira visakhapatnamensis TaxID=390880 RepID=A0A7W6WAW5_9PROT|nr:bacteriohemerythrin [Roseospira visakhapatnamensis]MBB4266931.1 hemerythrin [Roseospira visakhapatnamensis]